MPPTILTLLFFLIAAALVLAGLYLCIKPQPKNLQQSMFASEQKLAVLRQRRAEVDQDLANNLVSREKAEETKAEMDKAMENLKNEASAKGPDDNKGLLKAMRFAVALFIPVFAVALYLHVGNPNFVLDPKSRQQAAIDQAYPELDLPDAVEKLKQYLAENPDDATAQELLFRALMTLQRYDEAVTEIERLRQVKGDTADILVMQAETIALASGTGIEGSSLELIDRALELEPDHQIALLLKAIAAENTGDFATAVNLYMRAGEATDDPAQKQEYMELAEMARAQGATQADVASTANEPATKDHVNLFVRLDPSLSTEVEQGHALFVFARESNGPAMPIAVARLTAADLPVSVSLDDSLAMLPDRRLSMFDEVEVVARISPTGNASAASGDLQGMIESVKVGGDAVLTLTIDSMVP